MNTDINTIASKVEATRIAMLPWLAFSFCTFLCGLLVFMRMRTGIDAAFPTFYCSLPMAFFFVGIALAHILKELKRMSDRISQLEKEKR